MQKDLLVRRPLQSNKRYAERALMKHNLASKQTRETLEECMPEGGYCLGTGNTVANYIPLNNYLAMLDEGRNYM